MFWVLEEYTLVSQSTRDHIVEAADQLIYHQGFEHTSFADIARAVKISRGNFYYHFKSKDDILHAVIEARLEKTRHMLAEWEAESEGPEERIRNFIHILIMNRQDIQQYGCPVGTLSAELAKLNHPAHPEARDIFALFCDWLARQFVALGRKSEAEALAMHLLGRSQGVATLASAFQNQDFIKQEVQMMCDWLTKCIHETD